MPAWAHGEGLELNDGLKKRLGNDHPSTCLSCRFDYCIPFEAHTKNIRGEEVNSEHLERERSPSPRAGRKRNKWGKIEFGRLLLFLFDQWTSILDQPFRWLAAAAATLASTKALVAAAALARARVTRTPRPTP